MKKEFRTKAFVFIIVCAIISLSVSTIALADEMIVSGDFEYYISPETAHEDYRGTVIITKYLGNDADVIVPSEIDGKTVTLIDDDAFRNNENLKSVKLPDTLIGIGVEAFAFCKSLESVNIPEGLKDFGPAFRGCEKLKSIVIPEGIERLEQGMFAECTALTTVTLPNSLKIIDPLVFDSCAALADISIPNGVTEIGGYAFSGCIALSEISIPEGVKTIGAHAFDSCGLIKVTLPSTLESIGDEAFGGNSINKVKYNGTESDWEEKQFALAMGLSPYAKVKFADGNVNGESISNTSDESVEASKEVSQEVSNNEKNDEDTNGIMIVSIVVIVAIVICVIAVMFVKRKTKK